MKLSAANAIGAGHYILAGIWRYRIGRLACYGSERPRWTYRTVVRINIPQIGSINPQWSVNIRIGCCRQQAAAGFL